MAKFYPMISIISMIVFAWLGRRMAITRNRHSLVWGVAGALFPPLLLILKFLSVQPAEEAVDGPELDED